MMTERSRAQRYQATEEAAARLASPPRRPPPLEVLSPTSSLRSPGQSAASTSRAAQPQLQPSQPQGSCGKTASVLSVLTSWANPFAATTPAEAAPSVAPAPAPAPPLAPAPPPAGSSAAGRASGRASARGAHAKVDDHESAAALARERQLQTEHAAAHSQADSELRRSNAEEKERISTAQAKVDDRESANGGGRALPFPTVESSSRGPATTRKASVNDASAPARSPDFRQQALDAKQRGTQARSPDPSKGLSEAQVARASEAVSKRYAGLNKGAQSG